STPQFTNVTANSEGTDQIRVNWMYTGQNHVGFKIERSTDNANYSDSGTVGASIGNYPVTGLSAATTYYFRVRACFTSCIGGNAVLSEPSAIASATTDSVPVKK